MPSPKNQCDDVPARRVRAVAQVTPGQRRRDGAGHRRGRTRSAHRPPVRSCRRRYQGVWTSVIVLPPSRLVRRAPSRGSTSSMTSIDDDLHLPPGDEPVERRPRQLGSVGGDGSTVDERDVRRGTRPAPSAGASTSRSARVQRGEHRRRDRRRPGTRPSASDPTAPRPSGAPRTAPARRPRATNSAARSRSTTSWTSVMWAPMRAAITGIEAPADLVDAIDADRQRARARRSPAAARPISRSSSAASAACRRRCRTTTRSTPPQRSITAAEPTLPSSHVTSTRSTPTARAMTRLWRRISVA